MPNKFYSLPKSVFEHYHTKIKDWVRAVLPTKTSDLTNDSDFLDQLALAGIIAVTFSASSTYKVGDYVLYNHTLYRCKTAITTAGAWDASKWDTAKTQDIFKGSAPGLVPAAESGDADKVLKGDGTWGEVEAGSSVRVSYDSVTEELHMDFSPPPIVNIGGRSYPYVKIGNQLWLAENLDYKFAYNGGTLPIGVNGTPSTPSAWYYDNDEATYGVNGNKYGLLYNWYAAKYLDDNKSTLLPEGWHVPTTEEWDTLMNAVGGNSIAGTKLKSMTGWDSGNGDDSYGFTAFPSGYYDGSFRRLGQDSYLWTSNEINSMDAHFRNLSTGTLLNSNWYSKISGSSIRLVKTLT